MTAFVDRVTGIAGMHVLRARSFEYTVREYWAVFDYTFAGNVRHGFRQDWSTEVVDVTCVE